MTKNAYNELKNNTLIIAISNLGSKAISFILAPLYSFYLSTEQYGTMDLIITTAGLLLPLICCDVYEATFRFSSDDRYEKKTVFSNTLSICLIETIILIGILGMLHLFIQIPGIIFVCTFSAILDSYYYVLVQYARGTGKMKVFAFSGILNSILLLIANIVFMILLNLGITGWIISFIVGKAVAIIYLCFALEIWRLLSFSHVNYCFMKEVLNFCLPLMPSASMWWIMNASDRYMISLFISVSATGIYAVGNKLPAILSVFENVFYQAWQTTAINTMDDGARDAFYSSVFLKYFQLLCIGTIGILAILKPLILLCFANEYGAAWVCSAVLVVGVMVHALSGNLGTLYTVFKDTKGALKTSFIGALTNIILNLIFIPRFGMNAAAWTTLAGYIVVMGIRWKDVKKFVKLSIPFKTISTYIMFLVIQLVLYYVPGWRSFLFRVIICVFCFFIHQNFLLKIIKRR